MRLNSAQARHVADTLRVIAITQFGFFDYHGVSHWNALWYEGGFKYQVQKARHDVV